MKRFLFFCLFLLPRLAFAQTVVLNTNIWYSLTGPAGANTHFQDICPPNFFNGDAFDFFSQCKWLPISWSSGFLDPDRNYMYIHGGGHNNYSGNETYRLDLATFAKARITDPSTPTGSATVAQDCIGTPCVSNSKHTYDGMLWMTKPRRMMIIGGSPAKAGGFVPTIWTFDPMINDWVRHTSNFRSSSGGMTVIGVPIQSSDPIFATAYDALHDVVYMWDQVNAYAIDFNANTIRSLTNRTGGIIPFYSTGVYDPKRKVFVVMGGGSGQLFTFDMSAGPTTQTTFVDRSTAATTAGAAPVIGSSGPGVQYDPDLDRLVAWGSVANQNTIYKFDMDKVLTNDTTMLTTVTTTGAPSPIWSPSSANQGIYKRFQYAPKSKMYVYCGDFQANCFAFRLTTPDNTVRIKETSGVTQTNRPVTMGRPFRQGDIPNCPVAYISGSPVTTQTDVKNRWSDGSLKFGLVSFVIPTMTASSTTTVTFLNGTSCNNTGGLTQGAALSSPYNFDVTLSLAGTSTKTASARVMLSAANWRLWGTGSVMTDFLIEDRSAARIYDMDPNSDGARALHPLFECRFYPINNQVECGAILENDWISTTQANSTRDEAFTYSMTRGNTSPASVAVNWAGNLSETFSSTHPFTYMSRTHRWFCVSNCPGTILIDHNLAYLASTGLIENFDTSIVENAGQVTTRKSNWTNASKTIQGTFNGTTDYIGNWLRLGNDGGGGHNYIGLHNTWDIQYLYNMTSLDQTLEDLFYGNADLHGRLQIHNRELDNPAGRGLYYDNAYSTAHTSPLGRPLSIAARKEVSTQDYSDTCGGTIGVDKINTGPGTIEWSSYSPRYAAHHAPAAAHYQYLLSGRYFYLEEMQFDASYYLAWAHGCVDNSTAPGSSRQGDKGYWIGGASNEIRGLAWMLRSLIYAAITSPDSTPEQTYYQWYVAQNRAILEGSTGVTNTDAAHVTAYNYAVSFHKPVEGGSPLGEFQRYLDDGGSGVLLETGTPSRNVQNCNGAGFTCAVAPWMENFLLSAMGMGNDGGIDFNNLLAFRAKYNFGFVTGAVDTAFGDNYRMPGKVELSYSAAPGNTGQGWMLRWSDLLQYAQPRVGFSTSPGSDQQYGYINLGAMSFLGGQIAYGVDGATAYTAMRTAMNADFVAASSSYVLNVNGSRTPTDADNDSCKWCILPRTMLPAGAVIVTPPTPPAAPNAPTMVDVP